MTDPAPKLENDAAYSSLSPTEPKIVTANHLLQGDMTQAGKSSIENVDSHHNNSTGSGDTYLKISRFEREALGAEDASVKMTKQLESAKPVETLTELLRENRDPAQPRSNDVQEDGERSDIVAKVSTALDRTSSDGLGGPEPTAKVLDDLGPVYMLVECITQAVKLAPDGDPDKPGYLNSLGEAHQALFDRLGGLESIRTAVDCLTHSVALTPDDHPDKRDRLSSLANACQKLFDRLGELQHIHTAIDCQTQAVALTPDDDPNKPCQLSNLGGAYHRLFDRLGELQHIHTAVDCQTQAVALTPDGHPDKPTRLNNLGAAYQTLFDRLGELQHIRMAVDYQTQAVVLTPDGHPDKPSCLNNLGNAYRTLFERLGEIQHIRMAVDCQAQAAALTPDGHPGKPGRLSNLGGAYNLLFNRLGELQHLDMAIDCQEKAVVLTPDGHPRKPACLYNLGVAYQTLFDRLGELQHIHLAIDCQAKAVALTPDGHPDKPTRLNNLGAAYQTLFDRLGELQHIRMAVDYQTQAVALTPDGHPDKPARMSDLGDAYEKLFDSQLGELQHIRMAADCQAQAVALTPDDHPDKPGRLSNLGNAHKLLFDRLGDQQHLHMAIDCKKRSYTLTSEGNPLGAVFLASLGALYMLLFIASNELKHLAKSKLYSQCAALSPAGYPISRLRGAKLWAWLSIIDGSDALEAYGHCMLRLPEAVWLGTSVWRRFECLTSDAQGVISEAAVAAILAKRYDLAVEWLEQGRCLVWGQMLQLRTPLDILYASHPELANELYHLSSQLEDTGSFAQDRLTSSIHEAPLQNGSHLRSHLANTRDRLIAEIRLKPGFDDFLRPPKASTIMSHVQQGAIVILSVHQSRLTAVSRCDAIIIQSGGRAITHVPLLGFSHQKAEALRQQLASCLKSQGITRGFKKGDHPLQASFENILSTLWPDVVKPVLDHLSITRVRPIDELPHITWCITGALSFLPIHAAGICDNASTVLSNLVISSYTPTISSIGRSSSIAPTFSGILAIGHQSSIRGLSSLPGTKDELDMVEEQFASKRFTRLEEDAATVDAVVKAMGDHSWVHFACHGSQNLRDPMNSALHLHDKPLSLAIISRHPMKNAQLAFLSACQTAKGDSELPNEAVHLAAGLLMAGYANVIATMWSIRDQDAPIVAGETYKCLLEGGVPDSRKAAKALHRAVKHLRDEIGVKEFARWVPYIHMGG